MPQTAHFTNSRLGGMQTQVRTGAGAVRRHYHPRRQTRSTASRLAPGRRRRDRADGTGPDGGSADRRGHDQLTATGPAGVGAGLALCPLRPTSLA